MHRADRGGGERLQREIARGHGVQRIGHRPLEAKLGRGHVAVDGEGRAGQRGGAQRRLVHALPRIGEAAPVARQHLDVGEAMMAEGNRLRGLHMREARHQRAGIGFRLPRQRQLQPSKLAVEVADGAADIEPEIGRHLVVARACGVQLARDRADQLLQPRFHRHMDVFIFAAELEAALLDLGAHGIEPRDDGFRLLIGEDAHGAEHVGVSLACTNVFGVETPVEGNGGVDFLHDLGGLRLEAAAPHLIGHLGCRLRWLKAQH